MNTYRRKKIGKSDQISNLQSSFDCVCRRIEAGEGILMREAAMLHKRCAHSEIMSHINVAINDKAEWADPEIDFRHLLNYLVKKM